MNHPCHKCREANRPQCRTTCPRLQAWNDLKEMRKKEREREKILDGYICDACRQAKRGARRHDGRYVR